MNLTQGHHLAYCTNIHRGETWNEIFQALRSHSLAVRDRVAGDQPFGLGLRLGAIAAQELAERSTLLEFQRWLDRENCYVFTVNGFPYGTFHGTRVKEQVYRPDWATPERLAYTNLLFDLMAELVPPGGEGSVSTLPISFKGFDWTPVEREASRRFLLECATHIQRLSRTTGRDLHLGLEPEPLCLLETSDELISFLLEFDDAFREVVGMNYDCCHLAIEFEEPRETLEKLSAAGIRLSKFHLSSALRLHPSAEALARLREFDEDTYLHQVVVRPSDGGALRRHIDLPDALLAAAEGREAVSPTNGMAPDEWRVHFHVPVHAHPDLLFRDTRDHVSGVLDVLAAKPNLCHHLEIETYTWAVLPDALRQADVTDQIAAEYAWVLAEMRQRGLA
ncbi:MAG: metabolite traffic protein EboE [Verrucomicrobiales bacterium]